MKTNVHFVASGQIIHTFGEANEICILSKARIGLPMLILIDVVAKAEASIQSFGLWFSPKQAGHKIASTGQLMDFGVRS